MAVRLNAGGVEHRYSRRSRHGRMSDINVTPWSTSCWCR
jgi:hypothetical protein